MIIIYKAMQNNHLCISSVPNDVQMQHTYYE